MGELGGFVQEDVLNDQAIQRPQGRLDVLGVGIGLGNVLALDVHALEFPSNRCVKHVRNAQPRMGVDRDAPIGLKTRPCGAVADVLIAG